MAELLDLGAHIRVLEHRLQVVHVGDEWQLLDQPAVLLLRGRLLSLRSTPIRDVDHDAAVLGLTVGVDRKIGEEREAGTIDRWELDFVLVERNAAGVVVVEQVVADDAVVQPVRVDGGAADATTDDDHVRPGDRH